MHGTLLQKAEFPSLLAPLCGSLRNGLVGPPQGTPSHLLSWQSCEPALAFQALCGDRLLAACVRIQWYVCWLEQTKGVPVVREGY